MLFNRKRLEKTLQKNILISLGILHIYSTQKKIKLGY